MLNTALNICLNICFTINYNMGRTRVKIIAGTHRYEKAAFMLGIPLVGELNRKGIDARLYTVPEEIADTRKEVHNTYKINAKPRKQWWRELVSNKSNVQVFSLHSYPFDEPEKITQYSGYEEIGFIGKGENEAGVYIFGRQSLTERFGQDVFRTIIWLARLRKEAVSIYEDATLFFTSIIEVPAVPDESDPIGLRVDIERTIEAGFMGEKLVKMLSDEIEKRIYR